VWAYLYGSAVVQEIVFYRKIIPMLPACLVVGAFDLHHESCWSASFVFEGSNKDKISSII
jgi:hypothetical protein